MRCSAIRWMVRTVAMAGVVGIVTASVWAQAPAPTPAAAQAPGAGTQGPGAAAPTAPGLGQVWVGPTQVRDLQPVTYFYASADTSFATMAQTSASLVPAVRQAMAEGKVQITGPMVCVYPNLNMTGDMSKPFRVEIGYIVADGTQPFGQCKVRRLPAFHCASAVYTGGVAGIAQGYQTLIPSMVSQGLMPTGESRLYLLYMESPESANNVCWVTMATPRPGEAAGQNQPAGEKPSTAPGL